MDTVQANAMDAAYVDRHGAMCEAALTEAFNATVRARSSNPLESMAQSLLRQSETPPGSGTVKRPPVSRTDAPDEWTAASWLDSLDLSGRIAAALLGGTLPADQLAATRELSTSLASEAAMIEHLRSHGLLEALAGALLQPLRKLAAASKTGADGAASGKFVQEAGGFTLKCAAHRQRASGGGGPQPPGSCSPAGVVAWRLRQARARLPPVEPLVGCGLPPSFAALDRAGTATSPPSSAASRPRSARPTQRSTRRVLTRVRPKSQPSCDRHPDAQTPSCP